MRTILVLFIFGILLGVTSCRTDFDTVANNGNLVFSRDTIYLDTVFTNIGSSTYNLKVFNNSKNDITIPTIQLANGLNSKYRITVDGNSGTDGKLFNNITLLAKDSMYIFIETTAAITDANPTTFLYTDKIMFDSGANEQVVDLVTLIKDAVFLYPSKNSDGIKETITFEGATLEGFYLNDNDPINGNELLFTNQKPYVIYGYAAVPENKTVLFDAGSRVFFHKNSGLLVSKNATLTINGKQSTTTALENEVIFEGDRLEPDYKFIPGQWGRIWLAKGSLNHSISNLTLKNATDGLFIQNTNQSTTIIKNTQIYNCVNYGILAENAQIEGTNIVINSSGKANLSCYYGGNYQFTHCTFNNNWPSGNQVAVLISNSKTDAIPPYNDLTKATFNNSIIYGNNYNELLLEKNQNAQFTLQFNNCLIKQSTTNNDSNYNFSNDPVHYNAIILNKNPKFFNISKNELNIDKTSSAFAEGNSAYLIPLDVIGNLRTLPPDLGAYQNMDFPAKK